MYYYHYLGHSEKQNMTHAYLVFISSFLKSLESSNTRGMLKVPFSDNEGKFGETFGNKG